MDHFFTSSRISNLTEEQTIAYKLFLQGKNILVTGQAGTGKSFLIKKIVSYCEKTNKNFAVTAMTGSAAFLINGKTIHSWGSLGVGDKSAFSYAESILKTWPKKVKWQRCKVLIIDEVSMMNASFFELIEHVARLVKSSDKPFGGIQVILLGDFYQLPPVSKGIEDNRFCFESDRWVDVINEKIVLNEIIRQKDPSFQKVLSEVRTNNLSQETIDIINSRVGIEPDLSIGIIPTILYSTKKSVDKMNKQEFDKLAGDEVIEYETTYEILSERTSKIKEIEYEKYKQFIDSENNYEKTLFLAVGAQVMLLKNIDQEKGLVNGSRGVVIGFDDNCLPMVKFCSGEIHTIHYHDYLYEISNVTQLIAKQIPLSLAWCTTIHKSQGQTLDSVKINIGRGIFEYGQTYVALSRARNLEGLYIEDFDEKKIRVHPKVVDFFSL